MNMSNYRELSVITRRDLKNAFPQCKFSLQVNHYGGTVVVLKAPKSWYTPQLINNRKNYYNRTANDLWLERNEELTTEGKNALLKIVAILRKNLGKITGGYYDESIMESVRYSPDVYMYGTYSQPLEFIEDGEMKGHKTTPSKHSVVSMHYLQNSVRKMF